jgi:carboxymethylenebutenolidase
MKISIDTRDGSCPVYVYRPDGNGLWPGVLVFMDGLGIRPAILEITERLAASGYFVLLPDLYYRSGPYEPMNARTVCADPEQRKVLMEEFMASIRGFTVFEQTFKEFGLLAAPISGVIQSSG